MTPREKITRLVKGRPVDPEPLFFPLVHALGARIEEIELAEFLTNPTKLAKGLKELNEAIEADAIVCCCAAAIEAEGVGAEVVWDEYPPRVVRNPAALELTDESIDRALACPRIAAAVEATRRLAATVRGEPALIACLTGPMTLAAQLGGAGFVAAAEAGDAMAWRTLDFAGRLSVAVAKEFLKAGANVLLLLEEEPLPAVDSPAFAEWKSAVVPLANVGRFHQALPVVMPLGLRQGDDLERFLDHLPRTLGAFLPSEQAQAVAAHERLLGVAVALDAEPTGATGGSKVVVTAGEISLHRSIAELRQACAGLRSVMTRC